MLSHVLALGSALALSSTPLQAQSEEADGANLPQRFGDLAREHLQRPELDERVLERRRSGSFSRLLQGLNLDLKVREKDAEGELGLGFGFDIAKTLAQPEDERDAYLDFVAFGNVGFDADSNPDDFLSFALRARWVGHAALAGGDSRVKLAGELPNPDTDVIAAFDRERFADLATRYSKLPTQSAVRADAAFQALAQPYLRSVERALPAELVYDLDLHLGLESNQRFSARQHVFGLGFASRIVSWDRESALARANVFDWPAAALRWLAGREELASASLSSWPTVVLGLDVVDGGDDPLRTAATDDDSFLRARVEIGQRSQLFELEGDDLDLTWAWRFYEELDAPAAVRRADIDRFDQLSAKLDLPQGWFLEYTTGRLPLDPRDDSSFALGFNLSF